MATPKSAAEASPRPSTTGSAGGHAQVCDAFVQCHLADRAWDCSQGPARPAVTVPAIRLMREWGGQVAGDDIDAQTRDLALVQLSRCDAGHSDMIIADFMQRLRVQRPHEAVTTTVGRILPDQPMIANQSVRADSHNSRIRAWSSNWTRSDQPTFRNQSARAASRGGSSDRPWSQRRTLVTSELAPVHDDHEAAKVRTADLLPMTTSGVRRAYDPMFRARLTKPGALQARAPKAVAQRTVTVRSGGGLDHRVRQPAHTLHRLT